MAFSYNTKVQAFKKANGQCECKRINCGHIGRCSRKCIPQKNSSLQILGYGDEYIFPGFEFHHVTSVEANGTDSLDNCEFLCKQCHGNTKSYGNNLTR